MVLSDKSQEGRYDHYEFLLISFGYMNALVVFINLKDQEFIANLDMFVVLFINDVLAYSKTRNSIPSI